MPDPSPRGATLMAAAPDPATTCAAILEAGQEIWIFTAVTRGRKAKRAARRDRER
jgi:hypothetical protein